MRRFSLCIAALAAAIATFAGASRIVDARISEPTEIGMDVFPLIQRVIHKMRAFADVDSDIMRLVFIGDSTAISYPYHQRLPRMLQRSMRSALPRLKLKVHSIAFSGMHPSDHYHLSSMIMAEEPDALLIGFNLASFDRTWVEKNTRPHLAGWIEPSRIPEAARLPMHWMSLSLDELLLYTAIVRSGNQVPWLDALHRQADVREAYDSWVEEIDGPPRTIYGTTARKFWLADVTPKRPTALYIQRRWGGALAGVDPDHAVLRIFKAALEKYRERDTPVWVYTVPLNHEHFEKMGQLNREGLRHTLDSVRSVVESTGAHLIDLHQLIPDKGYRDASGHYTVDPPIEGTKIIADAIADVLRMPLREIAGLAN